MLTVILVLVSVNNNCQILLFVTLEDTTAQKHCILGSGCCRGCLFGKDKHIGKNSYKLLLLLLLLLLYIL
jgi:hypothetical protein